MAAVILATMGTHGDLAPFLALARALAARGHRPLLIANPGHRAAIAAAGQDAAAWVGPDLAIGEVLRRHPEYMGLRGGALVVRDFFARLAPEFHRATRALIVRERPAAVVAHLGLSGCAWAARQAGLPLALVHLAPLTWAARDDLGHYGALAPPVRLLLPLVDRRLGGLVAGAARACGAPPPTGFIRAVTDADLVLGLWSPSLRPALPGDPPRSQVCGTAWPVEARAPLPPAVEDFLAAGEPPVAVGLGTSAVHVAGRIYERCLRACDRLGRRCVIACGQRRIAGDPRRVLALPRIQFHGLFPRCAAVVHHGGIGSTMAALAAGAPQVVLPFAHDQFDNAARIRRLGAGRWRWQALATAEALAPLLAQAIAADAPRAAALARAVAGERDGAEVAAEAVAGLMRR